MPHDLDVSSFNETADAHRLLLIAMKVASFVDALQEDFDKLGEARDMLRTPYPIRTRATSRWDRAALAEAVGEALSDHLLNEEATRVFALAVRSEVA